MAQIPDFMGRRVQLWSRSGTYEYKDEGTLRAVTDRWVIIEGDDGEWLLFPTIAVRLVKVLPEPHRSER